MNALNLYDPLFYANEGIAALKKTLGYASRVYRGYDRTPQEKGSIINISKPSTFIAQDAPSTAQDLNPGSLQMTLNKWKEVKFRITDKEHTFTGDKIINDHIMPAAYALALDVDTTLAAEAKNIPWYVDTTSPAAVADITAARKVLFGNGVPLTPGMIHGVLDGTLSSEFLNVQAFSTDQGSGAVGVNTQLTGSLGVRYGIEFSESNNVYSHTSGVSADATGALVGSHAAGTSTVAFDGVTTAGTFKAGDSFVIAGNVQRYVLTADATASAGAVSATAIYPPLVQTYAATSVITFSLLNHTASMVFHRDAFALAMAPLSEMARELGAKVETVTDPDSGLSVRARVFYVGDASAIYVALDILYGVKTLDPNKAVRLRD